MTKKSFVETLTRIGLAKGIILVMGLQTRWGGEIDEGRVGGIRGEGICSDRKEVKGTKVDD